MVMADEYELETPTVWQRIFLKSKVNGAPYEEPQVDSKWSWPENTYLQRRLEYLRTYRSVDGTLISLFRTEPWEPGKPLSESDTRDGEPRGRPENKSKNPEAQPVLMERVPSRPSAAHGQGVERSSVLSDSPGLATNRIPTDPIQIDIPSDDWAWFADPGSTSYS
jgi:hypothetical protein